MSESTSETTVDRKLFEIFEEAFNLYYSFETCNDPTNSLEFQVTFISLVKSITINYIKIVSF